MNKFTVEEINFMCVFETQNRMKMMEEIRLLSSKLNAASSVTLKQVFYSA